MYDIIVVGAGPAGLTASANTSYRGLKTLVIEKQDVPGGLPALLYPDKIIRDHPGFPVGVLGKELSRMLYIQSTNSNAEIRLGEEVLKIEKLDDDLIEVNTSQDVYRGKRVIICTGIYNVPKKLKVLEDYSGPNVYYKIENPRLFKGQPVTVIGGGDHAFDSAIQITDFTKNVTVLVKQNIAKAKWNTIQLAEEKGVNVLYNTEMIRVLKDKSGISKRIQIINNISGEKKVIKSDHIIIAIGFEPIRKFLENNGFQLQKDGSLEINKNLETNISGIFGAGDVTGEVRLISTACSEGIIAAVHAFEEIKKPYWLR